MLIIDSNVCGSGANKNTELPQEDHGDMLRPKETTQAARQSDNTQSAASSQVGKSSNCHMTKVHIAGSVCSAGL